MDNGNSWTQITGNFTINGFAYYTGMSIAINLNDDLFVGTLGGGIFRSTDNGDSWIALENYRIVEGQVPNSLEINSNGDIFVGTYDRDTYIGGVFCSKDKGESWFELGNELKTGVMCLAINTNGYIFAGTYGASVFRSINSTTSVENVGSLPDLYTLSQNFPNPFNPTTTIKYSIAPPNLPEGEVLQHVTLKVYDVLGREVATLVNEEKLPGNYEIKFDGNNLSSGVYFYRLQAGSFSDSKKFILLR